MFAAQNDVKRLILYVESIISTNQRLTLEQIRNIRSSGALPAGYRLI